MKAQERRFGLALMPVLALMLAGYLLLFRGWRQVHGARGRLVSDGLYAYVRHPQYTGLFLIIAGFLVQWPTLITVLMTPVLAYAYVRLARQEEGIMGERFGYAYDRYAERTARFFPPLGEWGAFLSTRVPNNAEEGGGRWKDS